MKERAREADGKKLVAMKKLREENQKRAQRIKGRKERQLKIVKEERIEKRRRIQRGMQALKEIQKYQKGADLLIWRLPFQRLVREIYTEKERRAKISECSSFSITRGRGSFPGGAFRASQPVCHPCKAGYNYAKRHSVGTKNQRGLLYGEIFGRSCREKCGGFIGIIKLQDKS